MYFESDRHDIFLILFPLYFPLQFTVDAVLPDVD